MAAVLLRPIAEAEFNSRDPSRQVIIHDHARCFADAQFPISGVTVSISWRSDLVEPVTEIDENNKCVWIGIDERLVAISLTGHVLFSIALHTPLLDILCLPDTRIAICETEAVIVNDGYSIRSIIGFRDVATNWSVNGDQLSVTFLDGSTGTFVL